MSRRRAAVYLGLGANLGDREQNIRRAIGMLADQVAIDRVSSIYESAPVGYLDQPDFLNAACRGRTAMAPEDLLAFIKAIEARVGRTSSFRNAPRLIDIDILLYDGLVLDTPDLAIPHPRMAGRAFVLAPMTEIAPRARHPVLGRTMARLLAELPPGQARRANPLPAPPVRFRRSGKAPTRWIELTVTAQPELVEPLMELFTRRGRARVAIEEQPSDARSAEPWQGETEASTAGATHPSVTLRAYLPATPAGQRGKQRIEIGLELLGMIGAMPSVRERLVEQDEWEAALRAHFPLLHVGQRLVLQPEWTSYQPGEGEVVVVLDPGAAFGTGHHPTTRLCLELLERWVKPGCGVLDIGTGSGILAIAAAGLGAGRVLGCDTDPVAVTAARRNIRFNRVQRRVHVLRGSLPTASSEVFDLVVANITVRIICDLLPSLRERLAPGGALIVSGILVEQRAQLIAALGSAGLHAIEEREHAGWLALAISA